MPEQKTRQEIIDLLTQCGSLSYKNFVDLMYSIPFIYEDEQFDDYISRFTGEWSLENSQNGKYDVGYFVSYENRIYKSEIENNQTIPEEISATWTLQSDSVIGESAGFIPVFGTVLPNSVDKDSGYTLVTNGTYTQTTGGNVVANEELNILGWNGTTWTLVKGISIKQGSVLIDVAGSVLPNETSIESGFAFVGAGTFTQTTGGNITTIARLNILEWNGVTWTVYREVPDIDLSDYARVTYVNSLTAPIPGKEDKSNKVQAVGIPSVDQYPSTKALIDFFNTSNVSFKGNATPGGTPVAGDGFWTSTVAGVYTNFGGVTVNANSFAIIARISGVWSISQVAISANNTVHLSSVNGNDAFDGKTESTPVKTISLALSMLPSGGRLRVECNSVYREMLNLSAIQDVTLEYYGWGSRPIFTAFDVVDNATITFVEDNLYKVDIYVWGNSTANRNYCSMFMNGERMTQFAVGDAGIANQAAALTAVKANNNTYHFTGGTLATGWAPGVKTFYFSSNINPVSNFYEIATRETAIKLRDSATASIRMEGIHHRGNMHHDGLTSVSSKWFMRNCKVSDVPSHGIISGFSRFENCEVVNCDPRYGRYYFHWLRSGLAYSAGTIFYENCRAIGVKGLTVGTGFGGHSSGTVNMEKAIVRNCYTQNVSAPVGGSDIALVEVENLEIKDCLSIGGCGTNNTKVTFKKVRGNLVKNTANATATMIGLPLVGTTLRLEDVKLTVENSGNYTLAVGAGNVGTLDIEDIEIQFVNAPTNPNKSHLFDFGTTRTVDKFKIRKSMFTSMGSAFISFMRCQSISSFDCPDYQLSLNGIQQVTGIFLNAEPSAYINSVTTLLSAIPGGGKVLSVPGRKMYISNDLTRRQGANFNFSQGIKSVNGNKLGAYSNNLYLVKNGRIGTLDFYGNTIGINTLSFSTDMNFVFNVSTFLIGIGNNGYMTRGASENALVAMTPVTSEKLNYGSQRVFTSANNDGVIVGNNGVVLLTVDKGATWTIQTSGTANHLNKVGFYNNMYIAVGDNGTIITSPDGVSWTVRNSGVATHLKGVCFLNSRFIVVGDAGIILTSTDGITWTNVNWSSTTQKRDLVDVDASANRAIIITKPSNYALADLIISFDGIVFSDHPLELPFSPKSIAYSKASIDMWMIGGESDYIASSPNGSNWTFIPAYTV